MRTGIKTVVALAFVGVVAMAAAAFGQSGGSLPEPADTPPAATDEAKPGKRHHKPVHSETKVQTDDGFTTVIKDFGTATGADDATVTIERADGESVSATASEDTKVMRNGEPASVSDIRAGDHVMIMQTVTDGATTVRFIRAGDETFREEMAERKAGRMERKKEFKRRFRDDRGGGAPQPEDAAFFAA